MMANSKRIPTPEVIPPIPDTFENVIKALVKPQSKEVNHASSRPAPPGHSR